ncbi:MAG: hypothetical protein ACREUY_05325, partial [Burkholderiales bacterium]
RSMAHRRLLTAVALFVAFTFLTILPWTVANRLATGDWILISDTGSYHLWLGNHPAALPLYEERFANNEEFEKYSYDYLQDELPRQQITEWEAQGGYLSLSLSAREAKWRQAAWENARNYPAITARLWFYKLLAFWRPWLNAGADPRLLVVASGLVIVPFYLLAIFAAVRLYRQNEHGAFLLLLLMIFLTATAVHVASHVMMRFRLPFVEPYLSLLAGVALVEIAASFWQRRKAAIQTATT